MEIKSQSQEKHYVTLTVELSPEEVESGLARAYKKVVRQINVPGFRKGKFPRPMLEARYGVEVLYDDAIDALLPEAYDFILNETKLEPIDRPEVDVVTFEKGKVATVKFVVTVPPTVTLGEYKDLVVEITPTEVTEKEVDAELARLQNEHSRLVPVEEGPAQMGDFVKLNFDGSVDGVPFEGGKAENYELELGSNSFIPGFEGQLAGHVVHEDITVHVTFPETYHATELAGKAAVFLCQLTEIRRKEVLPLDDDFAKDVSEVETLEELRAQLRKNLTEAAEVKDKEARREAILTKVVENASVEIPEIMIERQAEQMLKNFENSLQRQGLKMTDYQNILGKTEADMKADFRPQAEKAVRHTLVIDEITKVENITANEEEIDTYLTEIAKSYQMELAAFKNIVNAQGMLPQMMSEVNYKKTVDFLVGK